VGTRAATLLICFPIKVPVSLKEIYTRMWVNGGWKSDADIRRNISRPCAPVSSINSDIATQRYIGLKRRDAQAKGGVGWRVFGAEKKDGIGSNAWRKLFRNVW